MPATSEPDVRGGAPSRDRWRHLVLAYSCRHHLSTGPTPAVGAPHFSLSLSAQRLVAACERLGVRTIAVPRPEIFGSDISRRFLAPDGERIVHLAVGDYRTLRILKGAYNIAWVAWEYEAISTEPPEGRPSWENQLWVLSLFDEVWVGARFVRQVFEKHGLRNVYVVPAPVPDYNPLTSTKPRIEQIIGKIRCAPLLFDFTRWHCGPRSIAENMMPFARFMEGYDRPKVYLTIVNPGDGRKNVEASILGFLDFAEDAPRSLLLVKLVTGDDKPLQHVLWETLLLRLQRLVRRGIVRSDSVVFVPGFLDEEKMMQLIGAADFYLSTSFAEGQNLPVLEAMSRGTVVIAPIHTAMADYLNGDNCVPCDSHRVMADGETLTGYAIGSVSRYEVSRAHVAAALAAASSLPKEELARRRRSAASTVAGAYDLDGVAARIASRFEEALRRRPAAREV
jgi:glycosyltransferase involved in cell wall biosynthesis